MQLNTLQSKTKRKANKRIGRGGTRGKTSGRGHKGQKAHGGHGMRPELRDTLKKIPKLRGHGKNRGRTFNPSKVRPQTVTLAMLEHAAEAGETITPRVLLAKGVVKRENGSTTPLVKVVATGTLSKKLVLQDCAISETAKKAVEDAGGSVA